MSKRWLLCLALLLGAPPALAQDEDDEAAPVIPLAQTPESELADFRRLFAEGDLEQRARVCRNLVFSGITDVALFDRIQAQVLQDYELTRQQGTLVKSIPACIRALASSGNPKYRELILSSVDRKPDRGPSWRYARAHMDRSIGLLDKFPVWNAQINDRRGQVAGEPWGVTRARNMLRADDPFLVKEGLKRARAAAPQHPALYDLIEQLLLADFAQADSRERIDLDAWFCKVLGESGNRKYAPTLERVAAQAPAEKLRNHAARVLERWADEQ